MKLFTPGPVNMSEEILKIGGEQPSYFRTESFTKINLENERLMLKLMNADEGSKFIPLTSSGTGAMDAVAANLIAKTDKVLVINGGPFGKRWVEICQFYEYNYIEYKVELGKNIDLNDLEEVLEQEDITVILMQGTETGTGQLYPLKEIGKIKKNKKIMLVVDAITTFLADDYDMKNWDIDITITSSQKGLALPLGMSFLVLNKVALNKLAEIKSKSFYFDLKLYIKELELGHTPYSPAITIIKQLNYQLNKIVEIGLNNHINEINKIALDFRNKVKKLPVQVIAETPSNCITALKIDEGIEVNVFEMFKYFEREYNIYLNKTWASNEFRIAHLGELTIEDNEYLVSLLKKYFDEVKTK